LREALHEMRAVQSALAVIGASDFVAMPSDTEITTLERLPALAARGQPLSLPVVELNEAQVGLFEMLKRSA
jgi:hypothetical protein